MKIIVKKIVSFNLAFLLLLNASYFCVSSLPANAQSAQNGDPNLMVEDVKIEGNRLVPTEEILNVVKTKRGDKFDRDQVLMDLKAVNSMGYFDDRNLQVLPELSGGGGVLLKIHVQENAPVTQFSFHGNQTLSTDEISKVFADQLGRPQNLNQLSAAIEKVEQRYHEAGYVLARITDVKDDPDGSISLSINEGVIDTIQITGNKKTKDFIIKRTMKLKPGSVYNERQLTQDLRKLYGNGYFQDIRRSLVPSANDPEKFTLKVDVDEKRTGTVGLGGGIDSIAGPFGSFSFSDSNFRGRGQVFSANAQIGTGMFNNLNNIVNNGGNQFLSNHRTYNVSSTFVEPNLFNTNTSMAVTAFGNSYNSMMIQQALQKTLGASVTFNRQLTKHINASLNIQGANTSLSDLSSEFTGGQNTLLFLTSRAMQLGTASTVTGAESVAESIRKQQLTGGTYFTVSPTISYDTRDNTRDPSQGTVARLTAGPSLGITGSSFGKIGGSVSKYYKLTEASTLAFNVQGGQAIGNVPQFAMYQLGGFNGIRGYRSFSDLGTGSSMLMASAEVRHRLPIPKLDPSNKMAGFVNPVIQNIKGVMFFDAGQVSGNSVINNFFERGNMGAAVGVGLRINVPMIGVVRLNYGLPLISTAMGNLTPRFTVGFGNQF